MTSLGHGLALALRDLMEKIMGLRPGESIMRSSYPSRRAGWFIGGFALLLCGCALVRAQPPATTFAGPARSALVFSVGFTDALAADRVVYRDPSEYEEYARIVGAARAETLYSVANGPQTALDFPKFRLRSLAERWRFNGANIDDGGNNKGQGGAIVDWGSAELLKIDGRTLRYVMYTRRADNRQDARRCVAFLRAWASALDDPRYRPRRAAFGYYCAPGGRVFDDAAARAVLRGLVFAATDPRRVYYGQALRRDPAALALARGQASGNRGLPDFPLHFSRYYTVSGDDEKLP